MAPSPDAAADAGRVGLCPLAQLRALARRLSGLRVTVMGLGLFGGGEGAVRFLARRGARLTVTDLKPAERLAPVLERLGRLEARYRLGEHVEADFTRADLVVANPAVPRGSPYLHAARDAGVPVTSPMNLFLALCPARIAAVTGSNGKSTTTALLAAMLGGTGRPVWLGGNIGLSLLPSLEHISPADSVVLELSSFQLQDAAWLRWSPHVAVVTNITPNHLDRHPSFEDYVAAKRGIIAHQGPDDFAVLNARDEVLGRWMAEGTAGRLVTFDSAPPAGPPGDGVSLRQGRLVWCSGGAHEVLCLREDVPLLGMHNVENAMAAAAAARYLGARSEDIRQALATFVGLEHRLELVGVFGGVRYYNDSYSTTPASGVAAVSSFAAPVVVIAGGYDKKLDLTPFARAAAASAQVVITVGQTGGFLARRTRQESLYLGRAVLVREAATLEEAVGLAGRLAMPGTAVVFSPACASYDMFENYEQRGRVFKELVRRRGAGGTRSRKGA
jgi:UDP-N-acetylmuramoylalanine--D-glutamate ligase